MNKFKIGISQGRLIKPPNNELQWFPGRKWKEEFLIAQQIGLNHIELLAETNHNSSNPLWTKEGREEINKISQAYKIQNYSVCFDYLIENKIEDNFSIRSDLFDYTKNFIDACSELNITLIILPFLGVNNLNYLKVDLIQNFLEIIIPYAFKKNIFIAIESLAEPDLIKNLMEDFLNFSAGCVYDTGNRILLSNDQGEDIINLSKFINHVHIKDKNLKNENVVLGNGCVNFKKIFSALLKINYKGLLTMETNRGENPKITAINNIKLINKYL
tara:strand:- start:3395 stop:4210 length:816 start_codon:yes stop_codon:yes gene_type:complete